MHIKRWWALILRHNLGGIKMEEYKMLRLEMDDCIKKQDVLNDTVFTILGLTSILSYLDSIEKELLILILAISTILLARIIHCRNTVYYLATYLRYLENNSVIGINWENNILKFKESKTTANWLYKRYGGFSSIIKNMGFVLITLFVMYRFVISYVFAEKSAMSICLLVIALIICLFNIVLTLLICCDKKLKNIYYEKWIKVLGENKIE